MNTSADHPPLEPKLQWQGGIAFVTFVASIMVIAQADNLDGAFYDPYRPKLVVLSATLTGISFGFALSGRRQASFGNRALSWFVMILVALWVLGQTLRPSL